MSQFIWPPLTTANPSVAGTGAAAPASATEVAGVDSGTGNLVAVKVASDGTVQVGASALPLPTGAATSALQTTGNTTLSTISTAQTSGSQKTQVVDGSGNVQPSGDTVARAMFEKITDGTNTAAVKAASTAAGAADPALVVAISPNNTVAATQSGTWNVNNVSGTVSLPTGAATSANQTSMINVLPAARGVSTSANALGVTMASDQAPSTGFVRSATANFTATSQTVTINPSQCTMIYVQLSGTFTATYTMEASADNGTTWTTINGWDEGNGTLSSTGNVSGRQYTYPAFGNLMRARCSAYTSGTMVVTMIGGTGSQQALNVKPVSFFPIQGTTATGSTATGTQPVLGGAIYQTSPTVLSTGQQSFLQCDVNQNLKVTVVGNATSTSANTSVDSTALEASHVIKASAGRLFTLSGVNTKASAQYIQVFNSTTVPVDGTAPVLLAYVPAGGNFSWSFGDFGKYFSTGIAVSNSSTAATKTIGSADCWFNAEIA